ncbi:MAG: DUF6461 domain-containing protein [Chloroflexi bacterium]|nr:DUF6461 domain-containing protein [Chloroflexota bacterium]
MPLVRLERRQECVDEPVAPQATALVAVGRPRTSERASSNVLLPRSPARTRWPTFFTESDYAWAEEWQSLGVCIALVEKQTPEEVLSRLVIDPPTGTVAVQQARQWEAAQLYDTASGYRTTIEVGEVGGWTFAVELNGYQATMDNVIRRISDSTRAVIVYWSLNADMSLQWAIDGDIDRWFDPLLYENLAFAGVCPCRKRPDLPSVLGSQGPNHSSAVP